MSEENWWPSKEVYDPKITKEKWLELLKDENIFNFNSMCMMKRFLDIGGEATCVDMLKEFGRSVNFYNNEKWQTGERIYKKTNYPLSGHKINVVRYWVVCSSA